MKVCLLVAFLLSTLYCTAAEIILYKKSATVWLSKLTIKGQARDFIPGTISVVVADSTYDIRVLNDGSFNIPVVLKKGSTQIFVYTLHAGSRINSDTIQLYLPYQPFPVLSAQATVEGNKIRLSSRIVEDSVGTPLKYEWKASEGNPSPVSIEHPFDSTTLFSIPDKTGEYYFTLFAKTNEATDSFKTFITVTKDSVLPFDMHSGKASWIKSAVIYQVTPYIFTNARNYSSIENKLEELVSLGINTIYLQPIYKTERGGQGYDVIDYFTTRQDLGSEAALTSLISKAKSLGLRIIFDMVPNHTSINHPYAQDKIINGPSSHYSSFYQTEKDNAMYAMHYHDHPDGFIYYFWNTLVNLNYNNEEVQRWMIEVCKYWVRKYDIDGYRFDAVWGINSRTPAFSRRLQTELKSLKPDLVLIAEDKASLASTFKAGYDVAYDWDKSEEWVSKWAWQYEFDDTHAKTIFNHPSIGERKSLLKKALFSDGDSIGPRLRYMENNDLHRFIANHSRDVTKMVAAMMFALNGVPMMYNGQESGFRLFPYNSGPIYDSARSMRSYDPSLFDFYKKLIGIRKSSDALVNGNITEVELNNAPGAIAFSRKTAAGEVIVIVNMNNAKATVALKLQVGAAQQAQFADLLTGDSVIAQKQVNGFNVDVDAYSTRILQLNRTTNANASPAKMVIVPNPTPGDCTVMYNMEEEGMLMISVADANGTVMQRLSRKLPRGNNVVALSLNRIAAGTCYVRADDGRHTQTAELILVR